MNRKELLFIYINIDCLVVILSVLSLEKELTSQLIVLLNEQIKMNQHANIIPPNAISSPQQPQSQQSQGSTSSTGSLPISATQHTVQSKSESLDNIAKVKSLTGPLRDSLAVSIPMNRIQ